MTTTGPTTNQPSPGRYVFGDLIATGGMGEVYRATDTALDRPVAIKLLKPEYADDPINRARFDSEARHAAALHHPHVAAVYDVGEMPTASGLLRPYLVMELVDGQPLSTLLRDGRPLDPEAVRDLLGQAGDALAAAHRAGIVHRDVKPANILVTPDREVKVTDFGIARAASSSAITGTGQVMGTPQYLSPEQARGEQATPASDVYSLGVMAFECLAGHRPFQKDTAVATALAHLHDPVPPLPDTVPPDLAAVVTRALAKDPKERYPDAAAFTAALRGMGGDRTDTPASGTPVAVAAAPLTQVVSPTGANAATGVTSATPLTDEEEQERNWLNIALIVFLVLALVAIAIVAWLLLRGNGSPAPSNDLPTETTTSTSAPATSEPASPSASPSEITLEESAYTGQNIDTVLQALRDLGLRPKPVQQANDGTKKADTVISVSPTTGLHEGDTVTVNYYGQPRASATPTPTPTPSHTPTPSATPTPSSTPSASSSPSEPTTTSAAVTSAPSNTLNTSGAS